MMKNMNSKAVMKLNPRPNPIAPPMFAVKMKTIHNFYKRIPNDRVEYRGQVVLRLLGFFWHKA